MAFPAIQPSTGMIAQTTLANNAAAAGITIPSGGLNQSDLAAAAVANLLTDLAPNTNIPASCVQGSATTMQTLSAAAGAAKSCIVGQKAISAMADATFTDILTVTIPNAAHQAFLSVTLNGALGAGGAIGAGEASGTITYAFAITRTAGVATVVGTGTATGSATAAVSGAATIAILGQASSISGAVGATNTFTVQVKVTKGSGSSTNHTATALYELWNNAASGITVA